MKILVVSGFLGAGKTTFIEKLSEKIEQNIVVLENEYGEVGIDGDLLKKEDVNIWELTEGCICCSMESNFANSVMTISNTMDPDILIVEPTGVGLLSSVMENIKKVEYDRIKILNPVTIVDPACIDRYVDEFGEIFIDQIKSTNTIVLSKTDSMTESEIIEAKNKVHHINKNAKIFSDDFSSYSDSWFSNIVNDSWDSSKHFVVNEVATPNIENIGFKGISFESLWKFESYMSAVMRGSFGNVIRAKGFLKIEGVWSKMDIVDKKYTLTKIDPMEESKLILIGTNLNKAELETLFGHENN